MGRKQTIEVMNVNLPHHVSRVDSERYHAMKEALMKALPESPPGLTQKEMGQAVLPHLRQDLWPGGDKAMWWVKTVQLDLEARGEVRRNWDAKPNRWWKA